LKRLKLIGCFACIFGLTNWSHAQARPAAERVGIAQLGAGFSVANPQCPTVIIEGITDDCTSSTIVSGLSVYGTFDFSRHLGVQGDIHKLSLSRPGEDSYLFGPRYVFHYHHYNPYLKFQGGLSRFQTKYNTAYTYKIYAFGGGLDFHFREHINIRAIDIEYQRWFQFPPEGISPLVGTVGVAYAF
jgi:hypothetical protein